MHSESSRLLSVVFSLHFSDEDSMGLIDVVSDDDVCLLFFFLANTLYYFFSYSSAWAFILCRHIFPLYLNFIWHPFIPQVYGFAFVWIYSCSFRYWQRENRLSQNLHSKFLMPEWVYKCLLRANLVLYSFLQPSAEQTNLLASLLVIFIFFKLIYNKYIP